MNKNGRKQDYLIEEQFDVDPRTGVRTPSDWTFKVWADKDMKEVIASVEGVMDVLGRSTEFSVYIDKRYDIKFIQKEVGIAITKKLEE